MAKGFIPPHGGHAHLQSYRKAEIVYDATVYFCDRFFEKCDRTRDQMIQAARSGKQNIIEGSQVSGTSKEAEIKLTNVARGSLEELLSNYRDVLRTRGLDDWGRDHRYVKRLRTLTRNPEATYETFRKGIEHDDPAICANVIIGLIKVTTGPASEKWDTRVCLEAMVPSNRKFVMFFLVEGGIVARGGGDSHARWG